MSRKPESSISGRRISNFLAVQGVSATLKIFAGSSPLRCAKYVLIVGPCMPMGLFADDTFGSISGYHVSQNFTHAGQQLVNCGSGRSAVVTRRTNSAASSMIVKSAPKHVSST